MKIEKTELKDAFIIEPDVFGDSRGWFMETYSKIKLENETTVEFVQDNQSYSSQKGILRGLHCQTNPHCQTNHPPDALPIPSYRHRWGLQR